MLIKLFYEMIFIYNIRIFVKIDSVFKLICIYLNEKNNNKIAGISSSKCS